MLGLFGSLNMASRSLQTQMTGVEVAGQNLANINTTGYSRQRVQIATSTDLSTGLGQQGTGATAVAIQQVVSSLLNNQIQGQQSVSSYWSAQQSTLQSAQTDLNEFLDGTGSTDSTSASSDSTSSSGLSGQLSGLFSAFSSLATSPTSLTARQAVVNQAQNLASTFNQISSQLTQMQSSLNASVGTDVSSANEQLSNIAGLNQQITFAEFGGGNANDLLDEREQALENLSQLTDITTSTETSGAVDVSIGGQTLVSGGQVLDTLQTYDAGSGNLLVQTASGTNLTLAGGSIQGTIDARDGTLATLQNNVSTLASNLITQVNTVHGGGYSLTGSTGADFFSGTDAATITVNAALVNNPSLVQASGDATATGDNSVALSLAQLDDTTQSGLNDESFSDYYSQSVAELGNALSTANTQVTDQTSVSTMLATQRSSISGVSVDEEMTNLMGFQRAYEASAQLVTTINTLMGDTLAMKAS
jgi:flagellar hook-associated protein 1 FlgK